MVLNVVGFVVVLYVVGLVVVLYVVVLGVTDEYSCTVRSSSSYVIFKHSRTLYSIGHTSVLLVSDNVENCGKVTGELTVEVCVVLCVEVCVGVSVEAFVTGVAIVVIRVLSGLCVVEEHIGIIFFTLFGRG